MITLLTGLPGNGKTLFALWYVKQKAEREKREVFYHNIKDLTLPWTVCDPQKWFDLPHGCIIVIDEAQDVFPKKPNGAQLPDYYSELAKHRHRGVDIFLITQHPSLIDNFARQLVGQHFHSVRKFGLERSTIYEWSAVNAGPQMASSHKNAITMKWAYPKEVYTYYKSAELHTVKKAIPVKLLLALAFVVAMPIVGYLALDRFQARGKADAVAPAAVAVPASTASYGGGAGVGSGAGAAKVFDPVADARQFVAMNTPRVEGLPQTAPKFDELTKPTKVPVPAACIASAKSCRCFTQQGTAMEVKAGLCMEFAKNGYFQEFDPDREKVATAVTQRGQQALDQSPVGAVDNGFRGSFIADASSAARSPEFKSAARQ